MRIIILICVFISGFCFSQTEKKDSIPYYIQNWQDDFTMAIYPGCEKDKQYKKEKDHTKKNKYLRKCLSKSLNDAFWKDFKPKNKDLKKYADSINLKKIGVRMRFIIDSNGNLDMVSYVGDEFIGKNAVSFFNKLSTKLKNGKSKIIATKDEKGNAIDMSFRIYYVYRNEENSKKSKR